MDSSLLLQLTYEPESLRRIIQTASLTGCKAYVDRHSGARTYLIISVSERLGDKLALW